MKNQLSIYTGLLRLTIWFGTWLCIAALLHCSTLLHADGGFGSETTNGKVSGRALLPDGSPASGVVVMIRKADYVSKIPYDPEKPMSPTMRNGFTDGNGYFVLDSMDTGSYRIEINNLSSLATLSSCSVLPDRKVVDLGNATLMRCSTIKGEVNAATFPGALYVQVRGLERLVPIDSNGTYTIDDLPAGTFTLEIVSGSAAMQAVIMGNIAALAGATVSAPAVGWQFSKKMVLNTTSGGADIAGTVNSFPVLVRLTKNNFNFAQANGKGDDVRFMKSDSSALLPYEIEQWDSLNGSAAIWVLVDTVFGNNGTQSICMNWGAPNGPVSSSKAVFSVDNGFSAVWHLDKGSSDATASGWNGSASGTIDTTGIIGEGKKFNGSGFIKIPGLLGTLSSITLSAWAQLDSTTPGGGSEVLSIGDAALIRMDYALGGLGTIGAIHIPGVTDSVYYNVKSGQYLKQTGWHLLTFTVDQNNNNLALFIDGTISRLLTVSDATIDYAGVGLNTFIGAHGNGKTQFNFIGRIDEVRVQNVAVSADWVKLCYMNQRNDDKLVVMKN